MKAPEPQVRLKGNLFARPDYFRTDVEKGATRTPSGTRVCTLTSDFLLGFRDALEYECGKSARAVLLACGKRWGKTFIARLEKEIAAAYQTPAKDLPTGVVHACLADAFNYHGWGRLTIDLSAAEHGVILAEITDSVLPGLVASGDRPADDLMAGLLAAVFGHFAGANLDSVQTDCPSRGASASRFVVAAPAKAAEIAGWLAAEPLDHDAVVHRLTRPAAPPSAANGDTA